MTTLSRLEVEQGAKVLKLLGDKTRLTIVSILTHDECCVCELVEILEMSQPSISQHIAKLKTFDLVKERRKGQWIFYRFKNKETAIYPLVEGIVSNISEQKDRIKELEIKGLRVCCN